MTSPAQHRAALLLLALWIPAGAAGRDAVETGALFAPMGTTLPANPPRIRPPLGAPMQTILHEAELLARDLGPARRVELQLELRRRQISLDQDGLVHVEIVGPVGDAPVSEELVQKSGARLHGTWRHRADVFAPVERLTELAQRLPRGHFMTRAHVDTHDQVGGEGAAATFTDTYIAHGADGAGRTVAIIDSGFQGLAGSQAAGDAPASYFSANYSSGTFSGTTDHGTACVEAFFDHAPGASYRLYRIEGLTQFGQAVDDAIANGVNVISHSLSRYNQGWADNSGDACAAANDAADAGILFFTSAGNRALQHWRGQFSGDTNNWHRWSGTDISNNITLTPGASASFYLQWDTSVGAANYDFYLYNAAGTTVVASSTNSGQNFEEFSYSNGGSGDLVVQLAVHRVSGASAPLQVFMHASSLLIPFEYHMTAGSTTSPSNSTRANVISVGAVHWENYDSAEGAADVATVYSSRGPTNGGGIRPRLAGPTNTTTTVTGTFNGTSCATPNAAGAATAFWSSTNFHTSAVRAVLFEKAGIWKDWGSPGEDTVYGHGGVALAPHAWGTVWLASHFGNVLNASSAPYFSFAAAWNNAPAGGRIAVLSGGTYTAAELGSKAVTVETFGGTATVNAP